MLEQIDLRHFKCFEVLKLPLQPLTLLSGANASGKSSVMQAFALLHQTMREHEWSARLMLNGSAVRLGAAADVIDQVHGRRSCEIALLTHAGHFQWQFSGEREEMSLAVTGITISDASGVKRYMDGKDSIRYLLPSSGLPAPNLHEELTNTLRGLTYLTAERLGPREYYMLDDPQLTPVVGPRGEHAVSVLYSGRDTPVLDSLVAEGVPPTRLRQVEARMRCFFPGCGLAIEQVTRADAVTLGIRVSNDTDFHRPVHSGFGLTQVLPIVVAALSAVKSDLLLIENPEVHIHPGGQAAMGEFLAEVAAAGVQVIIETHSDHVLNGIRRAVKNGKLLSDSAALHFFRPRQEDARNGTAQVESPILDAAGNLDTWPEGFFDQFDKDMNYFAGWN